MARTTQNTAKTPIRYFQAGIFRMHSILSIILV
jgi:hypothetical protein